MKQTPAQETQYLLQFEPLIQCLSRDFWRRFGGDLDDYLQEARLAFLNHLRNVRDESMIPRCRMTIRGALSEFCRRMAPVSIPKYCFVEEIRKLRRVDYDAALLEVDRYHDCSAELYAELHEFEQSLTEQERIAFQMRRCGYTNREIIPCIGVTGESQMSRLMKGLLRKAFAYFTV